MRNPLRREIGDYRKIWAETAQPRTVSGHAGAGGPCAASPRPDHRASPTARSGPPWRGADLELEVRGRDPLRADATDADPEEGALHAGGPGIRRDAVVHAEDALGPEGRGPICPSWPA